MLNVYRKKMLTLYWKIMENFDHAYKMLIKHLKKCSTIIWKMLIKNFKNVNVFTKKYWPCVQKNMNRAFKKWNSSIYQYNNKTNAYHLKKGIVTGFDVPKKIKM